MGKKNKIHPYDEDSQNEKEMKNILKAKCCFLCCFGLLF